MRKAISVILSAVMVLSMLINLLRVFSSLPAISPIFWAWAIDVHERNIMSNEDASEKRGGRTAARVGGG